MVKLTELQGRGNKNLDRESNFKRNYFKLFKWREKYLKIIFLLFFIFFGTGVNLNSMIIADPAQEIKNNLKIPSRESIKQLDRELFTEVEKYIKNNSYGSKLKASKFIEYCYKEKFDILLALSQAHIESHFGTRGMAVKTNSVFNVGTYDNGRILYRYKDPNLSIAPYIYLVKNRYMVNNISVEDLLKPRSFVDYRGLRYASHIRYELLVKGVYDKISSETSIDSLWKFYIDENIINARKVYEYRDCLVDLILSAK